MIYILALVVFIAFIYGYKKYRTAFNPLSVTAVVMYGFFTILSYFSTVTLRVDSINFPIYYLDFTIAVSIVALLSFSIPFIIRPGFISKFLKKNLDKISKTKNEYETLTIFGFILVSVLCLGSYFSLVFFTDGGVLWITNPRAAYLNHRAGYGIYYISFLYSLLILYLYALYMWRPKVWGLLFITTFFFILGMFSGKKSFALIFIVITICYYNFNVRALGLKFIVIFTPFIFAIIGLLIYTGSGLEDQNFEILLEYFNYAEIPAEFLYRHEEFGYYLGKAFLTSFWVLVPRSLYPEKPFEYGASLVHQIIHPGLAETGHTSGYFMWLSSYLDFGILGVIIAFSFQGWLSRTIFEWYLSHRDTLFSFILMMHFSLFEVWFFLPAPFAFLMCLVLALISSLFRKRSFGMIFPK